MIIPMENFCNIVLANGVVFDIFKGDSLNIFYFPVYNVNNNEGKEKNRIAYP